MKYSPKKSCRGIVFTPTAMQLLEKYYLSSMGTEHLKKLKHQLVIYSCACHINIIMLSNIQKTGE